MDIQTATTEPGTSPTPDPATLADHEAEFGGHPPAPVATDAAGESASTDPKPRHRARSQQATAADVPRIQELTRRLRESEARARELEARLPTAAPPSEPAKATATPPQGFSFPKYEQWIAEHPEKDYEDYTDAKQDARDAWREARATEQQTASQRQDVLSARREADAAAAAVWDYRVSEFAKSHPDLETVLQSVDDRGGVPPLLEYVLKTDDNGPDLMYTLAKHPEMYDEMLLLTLGLQPSEQSVAILRRRLLSRVQAVLTGSAVPVSRPQPARPPNPVRTGPLKTGDEPPGDGSSLAEHERAYGPKRVR
jgi:hypothetical protein